MNSFAWCEGDVGFFNIGGNSLEYQCWGPSPANAPTIMLLHEGLGCVELWRDFPQNLAAATGLGVFAYSRAGYGQSALADLPRPLDYMTREALAVLPQVLDAIEFQRGILLGHSDGATIASIYAGSVEDHRIRGLILMAPHFFTEESGMVEIAAAKKAFDSTDLLSRLAKYHRDPENTFRGWNDAWLAPDFKNWNVGEVIDYIRVPVLAIQGENDQYGSLAQIQELESRLYSPVDVNILTECKHSPHLECADETLAAVSEYCARLIRIENQCVKVA